MLGCILHPQPRHRPFFLAVSMVWHTIGAILRVQTLESIVVISTQLLGAIFALTSAMIWGSGDFSGGLATRRSHQVQVLALASLSGLVALAALALVRQEAFPGLVGVGWSALAGVAGALGIASLYHGLSVGNAALVAPTAGVVGALVPVLFGAMVSGLPGTNQQLGFGLGLVGIWLVTQTPVVPGMPIRQGLGSAILAGIGFGGFFVLIAQVENGLFFTPLVIAKLMALLLALGLLAVRGLAFPSLRANPLGLLAGVLDAGGNVFYLIAREYTRLDVAAVLSSMYPAATVLLAGVLLQEQINRLQWLGVVVCICAVALIVQ